MIHLKPLLEIPPMSYTDWSKYFPIIPIIIGKDLN